MKADSTWLIDLQKLIASKKEKFSKASESIQEKVEADAELKLTRVDAKINLILTALINAEIITEKNRFMPQMNSGVDSSVMAYSIKHKRFSSMVYVYTDGDDIVIRDSSFLVGFGGFHPYLKRYSIEAVDDFDWLEFSEKLIDYVYEIIYKSKKVNEIRVFGRAFIDKKED